MQYLAVAIEGKAVFIDHARIRIALRVIDRKILSIQFLEDWGWR